VKIVVVFRIDCKQELQKSTENDDNLLRGAMWDVIGVGIFYKIYFHMNIKSIIMIMCTSGFVYTFGKGRKR